MPYSIKQSSISYEWVWQLTTRITHQTKISEQNVFQKSSQSLKLQTGLYRGA